MSVLNAISVSRRAVLGFIAIGLLWGSFAAQVPDLKARIGADDALFGVLLMASPLGLLTTLWIAPWLDARLRDWCLPFACGVLALAFVLPGLATTPAGFLVAMLAMGFASGLVDIVSNARVSELEARLNRPLMNANHGMFSVAYAASALATGAARELALPSVVIFGLLCAVVLAAIPFMRMPVTPVPETVRRATVLPWKIVALCGGIVLTAFFVEAVVESWSALHIERTLDGRAAEGALGPALLGATMAFGRLLGQSVAHRYSDTMIITIGSAMACLGAFLAAVAASPLVAYIGFGTIGLGTSVVGPLALAQVGRLVPPVQRVRAVAYVNVMGFGAFLFAPLVMGFVSDAFGLRMAFAVVGMLALIAPVLALVLRAAPDQAQSP